MMICGPTLLHKTRLQILLVSLIVIQRYLSITLLSTLLTLLVRVIRLLRSVRCHIGIWTRNEDEP